MHIVLSAAKSFMKIDQNRLKIEVNDTSLVVDSSV